MELLHVFRVLRVQQSGARYAEGWSGSPVVITSGEGQEFLSTSTVCLMR